MQINTCKGTAIYNHIIINLLYSYHGKNFFFKIKIACTLPRRHQKIYSYCLICFFALPFALKGVKL